MRHVAARLEVPAVDGGGGVDLLRRALRGQAPLAAARATSCSHCAAVSSRAKAAQRFITSGLRQASSTAQRARWTSSVRPASSIRARQQGVEEHLEGAPQRLARQQRSKRATRWFQPGASSWRLTKACSACTGLNRRSRFGGSTSRGRGAGFLVAQRFDEAAQHGHARPLRQRQPRRPANPASRSRRMRTRRGSRSPPSHGWPWWTSSPRLPAA